MAATILVITAAVITVGFMAGIMVAGIMVAGIMAGMATISACRLESQKPPLTSALSRQRRAKLALALWSLLDCYDRPPLAVAHVRRVATSTDGAR